MCYQLVELYSACRCLYYQHAVDRCAAYGRPGHGIQMRTILVGYACSEHTSHAAGYDYSYSTHYSDSGYYSGRSSKSSRGHYRDWASYLYSFRVKSPVLVRTPSRLSFLFVGHDRLIST
ncbi:hypothetical protein C7999DRAFT_41839 [Corynascus novoguineensis]|uniref:Uncharacterized protein n=1 Tax=Corynascus novoguineensis TaxID=1126955 RepID=A0AAN7HPB3_9PEZI|nr:hypothetical protein C7999DRAFT_41839 [Corynascus novoguineensis]